MVEKLREGDTVSVVRLDRLGRCMMKLIELINSFKEKGVSFVSLTNNIDTTTTVGMVLFNMCAAFSEIERELIRKRVKAGLDAAHKKGRKGGRPKALTPKKLETLLSLKKSEEFSVSKICQTAGVTRPCTTEQLLNQVKIKMSGQFPEDLLPRKQGVSTLMYF